MDFALLEQYPVQVTIILFILGIVGFLIKHFFFSARENSAPYIKAGGNISAGGAINVGNQTINHTTQIHQANAAQTNLETFRKYIETSEWSQEWIDHREIWICQEDNSFQIHESDYHREFSEEWTKRFPDRNAAQHEIILVVNGSRIKSYYFISADGGRIFVPMPKSEVTDHTLSYYWNKDSMEYKIGRIVGKFDGYQSYEQLGNFVGVQTR